MKKTYILIALFVAHLGVAQNFQDTKGELAVSGSGTASYKVPIVIPPGIKDVAPQLALVYNGSSVQGMAGMGWNLVGVSSISRNSSRIDLDGTIDVVDFDNLDRFSLDGQRLIEKVGIYGVAGTTYQTENYSNLKIESAGKFEHRALDQCIYRGIDSGGLPIYDCSQPLNISGPQSFTVTFPDGTQAFYGGTVDSRGLSEWMINRWIDPQGNYIDYTYETENNATRIKQITWGKNINSASTYQNTIVFTYKDRLRAEYSYLAGAKIATTKILSYVTVTTGGQTFRTYTLEHENISGNYQRVKSITEANGAGEKANPVVFDYNTTADGFTMSAPFTSPSNNSLNDVKVTGDFDGDGNVDFVTSNKLYLSPINNNNVWTGIDFSIGVKNYFTATTLTNNKLNQFQSIVKVDETPTTVNFNVYNLTGSILTQSYSKNIALNNLGTSLGCLTGTYQKNSNLYYEGDYNGDGISEVLIISSINEISNYTIRQLPHELPECIGRATNSGLDYSIIDLNLNSPTTLNATNGYVKVPNTSIIGDLTLDVVLTSRYVADFNGDGKSDLLIIMLDKTYRIVTFKQLTVAPWVEVEVLGQGTMPEYDTTKQVVFGDFNGDSKTDIMIPVANQSSDWVLYQATGVGFEKIAYPNFEWYEPFPPKGAAMKHRIKTRNYRSADLDKDGKSDFVISEYETWCVADIVSNWQTCNRNGEGFFHLRKNIGSLDSKPLFDNRITSSAYTRDGNYGYESISLLIGDFKNQQANSNFAFIQGSQIWKGTFNKDISKEATLSKVAESGGAITQSISYKPLLPSSGLGTVNDIYHSSNTETYPYTELIKVPTMNVVDKLTVTGAGQTKSQLYKYFGLVTHSQGLGVLGFKKVARSSWYNDANTSKIWSCSQMNPQLIGQKIYDWTYSGDDHTNFTNPPLITATPTAISVTTNTFTYTPLANGVKIIVPTKSEQKDYLTGVTNKTEYFYDTYWNVKRTLTTNALGTNETINTVYDNPTGVGKLYALGRVTQTNQTVITYGDTFTTEEKFTYYPTATNLVQQSQKKGHLTSYITTDYGYDLFGNVTQKTITPPNTTARVIKDKYDTNGRFVIEKTDAEGLVTALEYNPLGQVTKTTNYLNVVNTTDYDNWGKITQNTTTGASTNALISVTNYARFADGGFSVSTSDTNRISRSFQDVFGRNIKSTTLNINFAWVSKSTEYDFLGRKTRESEPYFDTSSTLPTGSGTQWNTFAYDYLSRPITQTNFTGLTTTITYAGLTVSGTDGTKTTSSTKDANGNVVTATDNGGAINYTYYANGNLKTTKYGTNVISTEYDGWGRKTKLIDPSAGTYTYAYNGFGETIGDTSPKGSTDYILDAFGKLTAKYVNVINATGTAGTTSQLESSTTYTYDSVSKLPTLTVYAINFNPTITTSYIYDNLKRLQSTTETTPTAVFSKQVTYDAFGRINTETSTASTKVAPIKTSSKTIQNTYLNGYAYQIKDNATQQVLWQTDAVNARGQLTSAKLGNGVAITNTYDQYGYVTQVKHDKLGVDRMTLNTVFDAQRGNLTSRTNSLFGTNDRFGYDTFDRLTSYPNGLGQQLTQNYDDKGRITSNNVGTYNYGYSDKIYQNSSITPLPEGLGYYGNREGIYNNSMEEQTGFINGAPVPFTAAEATMSYDTTIKHTGAYSLRLTNTTTTSKTVQSPWVAIDNISNTKYTISGWVYSNGGNSALIHLMMKTATETGYYTAISTATPMPSYTGWHYYEQEITVPVNIKKLSLRLVTNITGAIYFDDVKIMKTLDITTGDRQLNIVYNSFKSPVSIEEKGIEKLTFTYNDGNDRSTMNYGGITGSSGTTYYTKSYSADGTMELKQNNATGAVEFTTYIGGDGYTAPIIVRSDGVTQKYLYLHRDYQGSILAITDEAGTIVEKRLFDAWGSLTQYYNANGTPFGGWGALDRGYTGHEHLQSVGLINMNARLYDPKLHRFLQPDALIPDPSDSQSYNRYGYAMNNPLKYTDPSGNEPITLAALATAALIGALIAGVAYTAIAFYTGTFTWGGLAKSIIVGAVSGAATNGIGNIAQSIKIGSDAFSIGSQILRQGASALMHGFAQAYIQGVSGGNANQSFVTAAVSSLAAGGYGMLGSATQTGVGQALFGAVAGGVTAALQHGNVFEGAAMGLTIALLNHVAHRITEIDPPGKKKVIYGNSDSHIPEEYRPTQYEKERAWKEFNYLAVGDPDDNWTYYYPDGSIETTTKSPQMMYLSSIVDGILPSHAMGKIITNFGPARNWLRFGESKHQGKTYFSARWGAGRDRFLQEITPALRKFNQWLRNFGGGHKDFYEIKK